MSKKNNKKKEKKMEAQIQPQNETPENTPIMEVAEESKQDSEIQEINESQATQEVELIGDFLKRKREEKNLSIKVIAQHTKISITLLELLEDNNTEQLPDKAYVTGFVKSYAKTIGIDQKEALEVLRQTYSEFTPQEIVFEAPEVQEARETEDKKTNLIKVSGVALAVVAIIAVATMSSKDSAKEDTVVSQPKEVVAKSLTEASPIAKEATPEVKAQTEKAEVTNKEVQTKEAVVAEKKVIEEPKKEIKEVEKKKEAKKEIRF